MLKWWKRSLFVLLPRTAQRAWWELNLPQPSFSYYWSDTELLCAWLHPNLTSVIRPMLIHPDDDPGGEEQDHVALFLLESKKHRERLDRLQQRLEDIGATAVEPAKARHMIAVVDADPFPTAETVEYRSVDLLRDPGVIPSPIDPASRKVRMTVCWLLGVELTDDDSPNFELLDELVAKTVRYRSLPLDSLVELDSNTISRDSYLLVHMEYQNPIGLESTNDLLQELEKPIVPALDEIEKKLRLHCQNVRRATRTYWDKELFIAFPESVG